MTKKKPRRRRRAGWALLLFGLAIAAAATAGTVWVQRELRAPYQGFPGDRITLVIANGQSAQGILQQLQSAGVVRRVPLARAYLRFVLHDPPLLAGEYEFTGPQTLPRVLATIVRGDVVARAVTLIEGMTLEETAAELERAEFGDAGRFLEAMRDPAAIRDLDPLASDLEGYLFPDTYAFARGYSEAAIVATLVRTFRARIAQVGEPAPGAPATLRQRVALASIVEKEARLPEERPLIAGVYAHRLRIGMALYADPTVIFALKRRGTWDGNLRRADLQLDDPYNTYRFPGLPPGPICSPGLASLEAASAPAAVPYLYFVSRNDGSHVFAETLAEHNRNVDKWQKEYWRARWAGRNP